MTNRQELLDYEEYMIDEHPFDETAPLLFDMDSRNYVIKALFEEDGFDDMTDCQLFLLGMIDADFIPSMNFYYWISGTC